MARVMQNRRGRKRVFADIDLFLKDETIEPVITIAKSKTIDPDPGEIDSHNAGKRRVPLPP